MAKAKKYVYRFGGGCADGKAEMKNLLGGKGANLAEMANLDIPVPAGFTITTEMCTVYYKMNRNYPKELNTQMQAGVKQIEKIMGAVFGDANNPLLVSVRSGARTSMPGMMDTVLNLGLNDVTVKGLAKQSKNERFAFDAYRRFVQMYGDVVLGLKPQSKTDMDPFEEIMDEVKKEKGVKLDVDLDVDSLKELVKRFKAAIKQRKGINFPEDPWKQLWGAIEAVFGSWNGERAIKYRQINKIPHDWGTAVNVQAMVYGNMGNDSGTGVAFTRNPATGERKFYGEYLINAQGEDVVAGIRTPQPINASTKSSADQKTLQEVMPKAYKTLENIYQKLEKHYTDMQDIEFTIQRGKLWMLQTRNGKRTAAAALKIACDMVKEKLISSETAVMRIAPSQLDQLLHPMFDPKAKKEVMAKGLPASPGAATGQAVFHADDAESWAKEGKRVILVRIETSPEDIGGMNAAEGILTARGGMTCIAGESMILTDKGFVSAEQAYHQLQAGEDLRILSYATQNGVSCWKKIIATGRRKAKTIKVLVSQTGRARHDVLDITADHKMFTFINRKMVKKRLNDILKNKEYINVLDKISQLNINKENPQKSYLVGAILTDGYINLKKTKGSVTFTQKNIPEKAEFINAVENYFSEVFPGNKFNIKRVKKTSGNLRGRRIEGEALDLICTQRYPAEVLSKLKQNLASWILSLDESALLSFLAGVADGDGSFSNNRMQIYIGKKDLLQAVVLTCLRLGISPQVTVNRNIYNLQVREGIDRILSYTTRVKGQMRERYYGTKLFSARQLFSDIIDEINHEGKTAQWVNRNLLIDAEKIKRDILPVCCPNPVRPELKRILASNLRMYRIKKIQNNPRAVFVYNFEVEANEELDKNYVVFSSLCTPILISNSHAAVVARGMGKCCVAGCGAVNISYKDKQFEVKGTVIKEGDWISLNGSSGEVMKGKVPTIQPALSGDFAKIMGWADKIRTLKVRTNADTPKDSKVARDFGAEGIGLCRTEHMFFEGDRIKAVREMILADDLEGRKKALAKLLPMQKGDFIGIFKEMQGLPVTIRLLDPPLHEFVPHEMAQQQEMADEMGVTLDKIRQKISSLHEFNPMLGHRGCRLGIIYPEITEMQARAIMEAACELKKQGVNVIPEIMVPLVGDALEFKNQELIIRWVADEAIKKYKVKLEYLVGTMIEIPRAALMADKIAESAEFFSFGTNDLTQMTMGLSRDDAGKFLPAYVEMGIYKNDPFQVLDWVGVGQLVEMGVKRGRAARKQLKVGICGEHGGDPESVEFCHNAGLNYVSCSPYRVPIARLAAAQAVLKNGIAKKTGRSARKR